MSDRPATAPGDSPPDAPDDSWADPYDTGRRREVASLVILLIATAAAFFPALSAGFIWRNDAARSLATLGWSFAHPRAVPVYRPFADALLWPQHTLWRDWNPGGYHLVSLLLHLANVTLVWLVLRRLRVSAAIMGAALFALHPIAVQPVAWIAQQPVLVATMFSLLATLAFLRLTHIDPPPPLAEGGWNLSHRRWLMAALLVAFQALALLADAPSACGLPVALAALAWWKRGRRERTMVIALAAMSLAVALFVVWAARSQATTAAPALIEWAGIVARGVGFHAGKLLAPYPLLLDYARLPLWTWFLFALAIAASVVL